MERSGKYRMSLSTMVLIGLGLGVLSGIFFGELVGFLQPIGEAFVKLLQMTVLPYIMVSLIVGLGQLTLSEAASLAKKCGLLLLVLWAIGLAMVFLIPLAFPDWKAASFFSASLVEQKHQFSFIRLFIPANIFASLTNNTVPAVVLFSIAVGAALMGVRKKDELIRNLSVVAQALTRVTVFIVNLAPIGVFAIAAGAAGTLSVDELGRLNVYALTFVVISLLLALWTLPALITALTPLKYKDVVGPARDALVTAFATGSVFVVLPILAERSKELLRKSGGGGQKSDSVVDVVVPTSFSFPTVGTVLSLTFVLFAGWFSGSDVAVSQYPVFALSGIASIFGGVVIAIPFMMELFHIPEDLFQLFIVLNSVVDSKFGTLVSAVHTLALALLGACAVSGLLKVSAKSLIRYGLLTLLLTSALIGMVRLLFEYGIGHEYKGYRNFMNMGLVYGSAPSKVYKSPPPLPFQNAQKSHLYQIKDRGYIQVGFLKDALPFAFTNTKGNLVGFDIDMAHALAGELGLALRFVPVDRKKVADLINSGYCDILMSGFAVTPKRAEQIAFSTSYMNQTIAFITKDHRRYEFNSRESVQSMSSPKIGVPNEPYLISKFRDYLPKANVVPLNSPREFFKAKQQKLDAMAYSAEAGSAWTLIYPEYSVAIPYPDIIGIPLAYAIPRGDPDFARFIDSWVELKKDDGTIKTLYNYWILGKRADRKAPRWSVIRNVLHWVD